MTAQFMDEVRFRRESYDLSAVEGGPLFDPGASGLKPGPWGTAHYRGFVCYYTVANRRLSLDRLSIALPDEPSDLLTTAGRVAGKTNEERGIWDYENLREPIAFTGRMLVGSRRASGLPYLNMGFAPAWCFERVWELTFDGGSLGIAADRSVALAEVRRRVLEGDTALTGQPDYSIQQRNPEEYQAALKRWIQATFSLDFSYSWPSTGPELATP